MKIENMCKVNLLTPCIHRPPSFRFNLYNGKQIVSVINSKIINNLFMQLFLILPRVHFYCVTNRTKCINKVGMV